MSPQTEHLPKQGGIGASYVYCLQSDIATAWAPSSTQLCRQMRCINTALGPPFGQRRLNGKRENLAGKWHVARSQCRGSGQKTQITKHEEITPFICCSTQLRHFCSSPSLGPGLARSSLARAAKTKSQSQQHNKVTFVTNTPPDLYPNFSSSSAVLDSLCATAWLQAITPRMKNTRSLLLYHNRVILSVTAPRFARNTAPISPAPHPFR
ncbi:hypothetical protein B0H67DRAFT_132816 [Lasiosphaeris hirsuta]|uniref:Uncharacterized protein n=1 Tax=Lasiosphaeris hirsuta TaxID=260670 RepID=A0AA40B0L7_9PEZI|nr:hypothetical protein B0H67DRAFT_132816 [Lasiosphaeris hirsuta]